MSDPIRLRDSRSAANETLRALLEAGHSEKPRGERLRGVAERLGLPTASGGAALLAKSGAGVGLFSATKLGAVVLLVGAATAALAVRGRTVPTASAPAPIAVTSVLQGETAPEPVDTFSVPPPEPPSASSPAAAPIPGLRRKTPTLSRRTTAVPAPSAPVDRSERVPLTPTGAPATWGSSAPVLPQVPAEEAAPVPGNLLEHARRELPGDPARALDLALRHERLFGGYVEDREDVILEALARLGRTAEGRVRAERFLHTFPDSTHRETIATLFGFDHAPQNPSPGPPLKE